MRHSPDPTRSGAVAAVVFGVLAVPLGVGWMLTERAYRDSLDRMLQVSASQAALRLRDFVDARLLAVDTLRTQWEAGAFPEGRGFSMQSKIVQSRFGGFRAINWIDPGGTIRIVAPEEGNQAALGKDLSARADTARLLEEARSSGEHSLSPPTELYQGPLGLASYFPVEFGADGFVNGVFEVNALVEDCLRTGLLEHYRITIRDGEITAYSSPGSPDPVDRSGFASFSLGGRDWQVELHPRRSFWRSQTARGHNYGFVIGLVLAAGIAMLVQVGVQRRRTVALEREHRARLEVRLREAQKLEALGRLAGGVAHDFNNALTVILGNLSLLQDEVDDEGRVLVEEIETVAERATELTGQLLAYAKREVVQPIALDIGAQVEGLWSMLRRLVRGDVELELSVGSGSVEALADPAAVDRILVNLVMNAADAIPGAGHVRVRVEARDTRLVPEPSGEVPEGRWVVLSVRDDGNGIRAEDRPHVFEPFFSTKEPAKGTGLGLSSVYGLTTQLGGHVTIETEPGVGSTFSIWLPPVASPPRSRAAESPRAAPPASSHIVLVVDDDAAVRRLVSAYLRRGGYEVWEAGSGEEALAMDVARLAFAIVDLVMPGMDGAEVGRRLRAANPDVGVVLCSGFAAEPEALHVALEDPRVTFLAKPFAMERLREALEGVAAR